jgi:hypothetical protein
MEQGTSWEANRFSASQESPAFYGTRSFITAFTNARHPSLSWASSIQSIPPHPIFWRFVLILSSHLCLVLPSDISKLKCYFQNVNSLAKAFELLDRSWSNSLYINTYTERCRIFLLFIVLRVAIHKEVMKFYVYGIYFMFYLIIKRHNTQVSIQSTSYIRKILRTGQF